MTFLRNFLRVYSYIFEFVLCAAGLLISAFAYMTGNHALHVAWLPWSPSEQPAWIVSLALIGLLSIALAIFGWFRLLLFLFAGYVCYLLFKGLFLGPYTFGSNQEFWNAVYLFAGSLLAFIGAFPVVPRKRVR